MTTVLADSRTRLPDSSLARLVADKAPELRRIVQEHGGGNLRLFGSVATGKVHPGSDIDLLFTIEKPMGFMTIAAMQNAMIDLLGVPVDLVADTCLSRFIRDRVLDEAVPL